MGEDLFLFFLCFFFMQKGTSEMPPKKKEEMPHGTIRDDNMHDAHCVVC